MIDRKHEQNLPRTERQLIKHIDALLDHFSAKSPEEIIQEGMKD